MNYLDEVDEYLLAINKMVLDGHRKYGNSCLKRGSTGLYMMLARKWDRIELAMEDADYTLDLALERNPPPDGLLDDIDDLVTYLVILRSDLKARKDNESPEEILSRLAASERTGLGETHPGWDSPKAQAVAEGSRQGSRNDEGT